MIEVLQTEVTGEGALSHPLKADRKESLWEFQGWLYLEGAKNRPFSMQNLSKLFYGGSSTPGIQSLFDMFDSHSWQLQAVCCTSQ